MNVRRFETFVIVAIIGVIGAIYAMTQAPVKNYTTKTPEQNAQTSQSQTEQTETNNEIQQVPTTYVKYDGIEGRNALELLKSFHQISTKEFAGVGEYVVGIDGVEADSKTNFWSFYVNGRQSPVGAGQYQTKNGDVLEWKLETIDPM